MRESEEKSRKGKIWENVGRKKGREKRRKRVKGDIEKRVRKVRK